MEKLMELLEQSLDESMIRATVSGRRRSGIPERVKIRPVRLREELRFQTTVSDGKREFHKNYKKEELLEQFQKWMPGDYRQLNLDTAAWFLQALVSKKGKAVLKKRIAPQKRETAVLEHNRKKRYLLEEGIPVPFLVDLGVMTEEGRVVHARYDKFRQINRFLEFVDDVLPELDQSRELTVIDFGCGKSYLTFAMYYYLRVQKHLNIRMIGLDLKQDVIEHYQELADQYGYEKLTFLTGDIAEYEGVDRADMVVTLHACDTATDYALEKALKWKAKVIMSVPCCQHELNRQIHSELMQPVLKYGVIRERMAALLTDAFRADLLELEGYQVQILEFIDMEHTPKNLMIRAVKKEPGTQAAARNASGGQALEACMEAWGVNPLFRRLREQERMKHEEDTD